MDTQERIERGHEWLVENFGPDYFHQINVREIDINSGCNCILGQLFGDYADACFETGIGIEERLACGFTGSWDTEDAFDDEVKRLTPAWKYYIERLQQAKYDGPSDDLQAIFDFVVRKLSWQGKASLRNGECAYRGDDGTCCAAGWIIPDEEYDFVAMEGLMVGELEVFDNWPHESRQLLLQLQRTHDNFQPDEWPGHWRRIARDFDLNTDAIPKKV